MLMAREAVKPDVAWPPVELLLLVHVERLDAWLAINDRLPPARSVLPMGVRLSAVPVRENTMLPEFGVSVHDSRVFADRNTIEGWTVQDVRALGVGAYSSYTAVVGAAVGLSSLAALPDGPRSDVEANAVVGLIEELNSSNERLTALVDANPDVPLLAEGRRLALELSCEALGELQGTAPSAGAVARWALQMQDGVGLDTPRSTTHLGCLFLLAEWDIAPTKASDWYGGSSEN